MTPSSLSSLSGDNAPVPAPKFRWGTRVALPLGILLSFAALFAGSVASSLTPAREVDAVPVVERPAIKRSAVTRNTAPGGTLVQAAGWIEPDPFVVYAATLTNGSVADVLFLEGERVAKGDTLVRLVDDDARLALQRAEVEARAADETWSANIEAQREASVAAASVREALASLGLARAELEVEKALFVDAERIHLRRMDLVSKGSIPQEEYDAAHTAAQAQAARVQVMERRIEELEAKLDRMKGEEIAAQQHLKLRTEERRRLDLARVALAEAQLRMERMEIKAPIDGAVMRRLVEPGSLVMMSSDNHEMARVAELYDPKKLQVRVDVPLSDAAKIGVGQPARIDIEVLSNQSFSGAVTRITNFADIQKNTLEVKVALHDPAPELRPEMLARVRFLAIDQQERQKQTGGALSVFAPVAAVNNGEAWVITQFDGAEGIVVRRSVTTTGAEEDGWTEIETGLHPGDLVVLSAENLQPQQRVRVRRGEKQ